MRRKADRRPKYHLDAMEDIMMHYTGNRLVTECSWLPHCLYISCRSESSNIS